MKLTNRKLRQLIKEELKVIMEQLSLPKPKVQPNPKDPATWQTVTIAVNKVLKPKTLDRWKRKGWSPATVLGAKSSKLPKLASTLMASFKLNPTTGMPAYIYIRAASAAAYSKAHGGRPMQMGSPRFWVGFRSNDTVTPPTTQKSSTPSANKPPRGFKFKQTTQVPQHAKTVQLPPVKLKKPSASTGRPGRSKHATERR